MPRPPVVLRENEECDRKVRRGLPVLPHHPDHGWNAIKALSIGRNGDYDPVSCHHRQCRELSQAGRGINQYEVVGRQMPDGLTQPNDAHEKVDKLALHARKGQSARNEMQAMYAPWFW